MPRLNVRSKRERIQLGLSNHTYRTCKEDAIKHFRIQKDCFDNSYYSKYQFYAFVANT